MREALPKISLVTPSFNQGKFIRETIESVLNQNYPNLEYWVIDGGSTDETLEILASYGKRLHWISEPDRGQTDAINKGLRKTTGEILGYVNSDDLLLPGALETVARAFQEHPGAQWLTGEYQIIDEHGQERDQAIVWYKKLQRWNMKLLPFTQKFVIGVNNPIIQPSTFWRRSLWEQVGPFSEGLRYTMDYEWWLRAWKVAPPLFTFRPLSAFRIHSQSKGGSQYQQQMAEQLKVAKEHGVPAGLLRLQDWHNRLIIWWYKRTK